MSASPEKKQKTESANDAMDWSKYAAKPSAEHEYLNSLAGTYHGKATYFFDPTLPEGQSQPFRVIYTSRFGGFQLEGKWFFYLDDSKKKVVLEGVESFGFDTARNEYYSTWLDQFGAQPCTGRGKKEGDIITLRGIKVDSQTGKDQAFRHTFNVKTHQTDMYKPKDDADTECTKLTMRLAPEFVPGPTSVNFFSLLVKNYDEAIQWYTEKLGFHVQQDIAHGTFRWVVMQAPGDAEFRINFMEPNNDEEKARVGKQASTLFFYLATNDCHRDYETMVGRGVEFTQKPTDQFYGTDAHLKDLYGNGIGLCQVKPH